MRLAILCGCAFSAALGAARLEAPPPRLTIQHDSTFVVPDSVLAQLTGIFNMALDRDGSLYLSDYRLPAVLQLEPSGALRRVIGRAGGGPGEFSYVLRVGVHGDSLWALDPGQVRLSLFPRDGRGVTTIPYSILARPAAGTVLPRSRRGMPYSILTDGSLLVQDNLRTSDNPVDGYLETRLLRTDRTLGVLDTIARYSMRHTALAFVYEDGESHFTQPFGDDPLFEASSDGAVLAVVTREAARSAGEQEFTVRFWREGAPRPMTRRMTYRPRPLPQRAVDSMIRFMAHPQEDRPPTPVTADSIRRRLFRPAFYPPVERLAVGRDGTIWLHVRFADSPVDGGDWLVLSARGLPAGRVRMPASFRLLETDGRVLYGTEGDPADVPRVVRYRLVGRAE